MPHFSASYSVTLRVHLDDEPGAFANLANAIATVGGNLDAIDLVRVEGDRKVRDIVVLATDAEHATRIVAAVESVDGVMVEHASDRTFLLHLGGKMEVASTIPLQTRDDLSMAYTPGVARVCMAIADDPETAWNLTIKGNAVAVVTDGTAVLGLGDIGPVAAMPVMEGKAILFKEFGGINAWPICLDTKDPDEIVAAVKALASGFGGINLEDISAPRCFEIERRLDEALDIPVFHDDQHGTAIVTLAALTNALQIVDKRLEDVTIVISGVGAAGVAVTDLLIDAGATNIIGCDRKGAIYAGRPDLDGIKVAYAARTNPEGLHGTADDVLRGADVFIGVSAPDAISPGGVFGMSSDPIVFAMANPTPEVSPEAVASKVAVLATGRSDYPNQINNVLAFPGVFRGALDARATSITPGMRTAAAAALATTIPPAELSADYIIPSVFNRSVASTIAHAVREAAETDGVARRLRAGSEDSKLADAR
ncbi:MAG TPA: NAD-dependent malic enzyme [Gaiellaceae bacterium]|nr:NAD-dependent malic enzyme [Gaiellaceae bacterium]